MCGAICEASHTTRGGIRHRGGPWPVQRGVTSPAFTPGPYSPVHEEGVIDFVEWYDYEAVVRRRLLEADGVSS